VAENTPRVALVTGAGRRLGRALAAGLAADGMRVAAHYHRSVDGAEAFVAEHGRGHAAFQADLADADEAAGLPGRVADHFGRLDVLVNSAAIMVRQPLGTVTPEAWDRVLALNLRAPFLVTQAAAPLLRAVRGCVVNVADVSGLDPWPSFLPHSAAKAGLLALTRGMAQVLAPHVRVNAIVPGAVLPPAEASPEALERLAKRALLRRLGAPEDVVGAMRFLIASAFMTGTVLVVDGGGLARARSDG
jgi:NAD(P)-dependent dehydrogenase (short-subunit alcohol dehydrogenase family)